MNRILYSLTLTIFLSILSACQKFEIISRKGSIVTVNDGYHPNRNPDKTIFGKRTPTDTTTGHIISVTKYRCNIGRFGREKCVSRTRKYKDGKWTIGWTRQKTMYEL